MASDASDYFQPIDERGAVVFVNLKEMPVRIFNLGSEFQFVSLCDYINGLTDILKKINPADASSDFYLSTRERSPLTGPQ